MKATPKKVPLALRQWAVEQAVKWPQAAYSYASGVAPSYMVSNVGPMYGDLDVIGRAEKLLAWVCK